MVSFVSSGAASDGDRGSSAFSGFSGNYGDVSATSAVGKAMDPPQALPRLQVRASGPGVEIRWEDFNYPPCLRLIHFNVSELQAKHKRTVRLLNTSFLLTTFICALNMLDTAILWGATESVPSSWVLQSLLHLLILPPAALVTFYIGYRGLVAPEQLLLRRFQLAQFVLAFVSMLFALVPFHCINGLLTLATSKPYSREGMTAFWIVAILAESMLWMLNTCLALLNVAQVRRVNAMPAFEYNSPRMGTKTRS